jgi:hypothetical protein
VRGCQLIFFLIFLYADFYFDLPSACFGTCFVVVFDCFGSRFVFGFGTCVDVPPFGNVIINFIVRLSPLSDVTFSACSLNVVHYRLPNPPFFMCFQLYRLSVSPFRMSLFSPVPCTWFTIAYLFPHFGTCFHCCLPVPFRNLISTLSSVCLPLSNVTFPACPSLSELVSTIAYLFPFGTCFHYRLPVPFRNLFPLLAYLFPFGTCFSTLSSHCLRMSPFPPCSSFSEPPAQLPLCFSGPSVRQPLPASLRRWRRRPLRARTRQCGCRRCRRCWMWAPRARECWGQATKCWVADGVGSELGSEWLLRAWVAAGWMGGCWELMLGARAQVDEPSWDLSWNPNGCWEHGWMGAVYA